MAVKFTKPEINVREKLAELDKPSGIAGEAMLRAETPQEQQALIGVGRRNILINGAMQIAQRATSATGITTAGYKALDRWEPNVATAGTWTLSQETDTPSGFGNSAKMLCTTADTSLATTHNVYFNQRVEGYNLQAFAKGTSDAKSLTMSFWVKSNVTGLYTAEIYDNDNDRMCGQNYTINSSGTWEYKTVTFPPDGTGTWNNDNNLSAFIAFWLAGGPSFNTGSGVGNWQSGNANRCPGQVNLAGAVNNYWQITGVQLEVGKIATPFEHRSYGEELALCQRYCYVIGNHSVSTSDLFAVGTGNGTGTSTTFHLHPVEMRAKPSLSYSALADFVCYNFATSTTLSAPTAINLITSIATQRWSYIDFTNSGTTTGSAIMLRAANTSTKLIFSAEL